MLAQIPVGIGSVVGLCVCVYVFESIEWQLFTKQLTGCLPQNLTETQHLAPAEVLQAGAQQA